MRSKGTIATWNDGKGFGFLAPLDGGQPVFIHIKAFANRNRRPAVGDVVTYALAKDDQGRTRAAQAALSGDKLQMKTRRRRTSASGIMLAVLMVACVYAYATDVSPTWLIIYSIVSTVTFFAYALDKHAALNGRWRISEGLLHLLAIAGGWPGAMLGQLAFRHKTRKQPFRFIFWFTVILNCAAFVWLRDPGRTIYFT
jgi:uncharacterized membrane protein YsdA (DUF1294 family)/cold shock CspA family protein